MAKALPSGPEHQRQVMLSREDESHIAQNRRHGANGIRTSKYTVLTFLPLNLFMQFNKAPNVYFLVIAFMQTIEMISISGGKSAMAVPLVFVVLVSMIKDAFEDFGRHKADGQENDAETLVYQHQTRSFQRMRWKEVHVGDVIKVEADDAIPADLLLLQCADAKGVCYVETKNLDGETNLKVKAAEKDLQAVFKDEKELGHLAGHVRCEKPNNAIYKFEGTI